MKTTRQRVPGHYVALFANADDAKAMALYAHKPGIVGVEKRYRWNSLEPVSGQYNFAELAADLVTCQALGLKLVAMIEDKSFVGPTRVLPKGMEAYEALNHGGTSTVPGSPQYGGYTALRWKPQVPVAMGNLMAQIGAQFDTNEAFEGVSFVESSLSMDNATLKANGYTPELYRDALIAMLTAAAVRLPHSQVFWNQNFLAGSPGPNGYLDDVADAVRKAGVSVGGPDALPTSANLVAQVYPRYERLRGKANLFIQMSQPGYQQLNPATSQYYTMQEMFEFCRDTLYSDYIFWMPTAHAAGSPGYGFADALPVIAANPVINF